MVDFCFFFSFIEFVGYEYCIGRNLVEGLIENVIIFSLIDFCFCIKEVIIEIGLFGLDFGIEGEKIGMCFFIWCIIISFKMKIF